MSKQKAHQKLNQLTAVLMMAAAAALAAPAVQAGAGPSGPGYTYEVPGQLGAVAVNPYCGHLQRRLCAEERFSAHRPETKRTGNRLQSGRQPG